MPDPADTLPWGKNWEAMSRQYWTAMQNLSQQAAAQAPGALPDATRPWHEGLEQWSRMFAGSNPQSEITERALAGAKGYMNLLQGLFAAGGAPDATPAAWRDALKQGFSQPGLDPMLANNPLAQAMRAMSGKGAHGFEQMLEQFSGGMAPMLNDAKGALELPAFGFQREKQEESQRSARYLLDFQQQVARYNGLLMKVSERSFALFESKLAEREEPGRQIDSARALYDLWVDASEEAYAEIALSDEFREVYGALVNAQMRVRGQTNKAVEQLSTDLGMPTRSEVDTIGQRLQETRRELRRLAEASVAVTPVADEGLVEEVAALRREVAELKRTSAARDVATANKPTPTSAPKPSKAPAETPAKAPAKASKAAKAAPASKVVKSAPAAKPAAPKKTRR